MKRIRDFLCKADPIGIAFVVVLGSLYLAMAIDMGIVKFISIIVIGLVLCGLITGVGWLVYKAVVFAQSHCK